MPIGCCCAGRKPDDLGVGEDGLLKAPPGTPNCASSDMRGADSALAKTQRVEPFVVVGEPEKAWEQVKETMRGWANTVITEEEDTYLHCECSTALWGFTDDVELHLRPDGDSAMIAIRSASRLGHGDLGTNKRRVEAIRQALVAEGGVAAAAGKGAASLAAATALTAEGAASKASFVNPMHTADDPADIDSEDEGDGSAGEGEGGGKVGAD